MFSTPIEAHYVGMRDFKAVLGVLYKIFMDQDGAISGCSCSCSLTGGLYN